MGNAGELMGSLFEGPQIKTPTSVTALSNPVSLKPVNMTAGGFSSSLNGNRLSVGTNATRQGLVSGLSNTSLNQANLLKGLRGQVMDATTGLRASRLAEVENARKASVSNLRDNLARRRVLGSSFGADAVTRANLEFAQQADQVTAESKLQEIQMKNDLINQEYQARTSAFNARIGELNLQADMATGLTQQVNQILAMAAQLKQNANVTQAQLDQNTALNQSQLDARAQEGAGSLFGKILGNEDTMSFIKKIAGIGLAPMTGGASLAFTQ